MHAATVERAFKRLPMDFSQIPKSAWKASNSLAFAFRDRYPVSRGHTLIVPHRVVPTWFEATRGEQVAILELLDVVKAQLDAELQPQGYNVGFNAGEAAGQTVAHLHLHVIPRYAGDMEDPTGGVRHVRPGMGNYRRQREDSLLTGGTQAPLLRAMRPLLRAAQEVDIVAAFVQDSGLRALEEDLSIALLNGAQVRLICGDYLDITQKHALQRLHDWQSRTCAYAEVDDGGLDAEKEAPLAGSLQVRVVETSELPPAGRSFHPKSWRIAGPDGAAAFVGSSNISHSALLTGVEWNARIERWIDPAAYDRVAEAFESLWGSSRPLDQAWIDAYREQVRQQRAGHALPPGEMEVEPCPEPPTPNAAQKRALAALVQARSDGIRRALVVMATGLGKTWCAGFDCMAFADEVGRAPRVLFVAHRRELLNQAADTFRTAFPDSSIGFFVGSRGELDADIVFASIQKLSRPEQLERLSRDAFDYVVVDEVHHAAAPSYASLIGRMDPGFLLGLTATPDRADEGDVLGLFDDNLVHRTDLAEGIELDLLVPFHYLGLKDEVDYAPIPWRNRRFDPRALEDAVETEARMATLWRAWEQQKGNRTLVFCASIHHAEFTARWLGEKGVRVQALHSGPDSADRESSLAALAEGELDALCSVDLFNEGLDLPSVDRVVMLRPTESPVVFLQQLGRGLRKHAEVAYLQVIDFVGNHKIFLDRVRHLLSLTSAQPALRQFLAGEVDADLPPGCSLELELEAKDLLSRLLGERGDSAAVEAYRELRLLHGVRPRAGELLRRGYNPRGIGGAGAWFEFVEGEGDLSGAETAAAQRAAEWLKALERTSMTKSFKMVTVQVLAEQGALHSGMEIGDLAAHCHAYIVRRPELFHEIEAVQALPDPVSTEPEVWTRYWKGNPLAAWANSQWFKVEADRFVPRLPFGATDEERAALVRMTAEIADWRMAQYLRRNSGGTKDRASFTVRVSWNKKNPILMLGQGELRGSLPDGEVDVVLPEGARWVFRFMKIAVNHACPAGAGENQLPSLLRRWFGPEAGRPGTDHHVKFYRSPDGWNVQPVEPSASRESEWGTLLAFPGPVAADGASLSVAEAGSDTFQLRLPDVRIGQVAILVQGFTSAPEAPQVREGDWLIAALSSEPSTSQAGGMLALLAIQEGDASKFELRQLEGVEGSYDPSRLPPGARLVAHVERVLPMESLAPPPGTELSDERLAGAFHLERPPSLTDPSVNGHAFLMLTGKEHLPAPDRCDVELPETINPLAAQVLIREAPGALWYYAGVARREGELWSFPALPLELWKGRLGGKGVSRTLPAGRRHEAERLTRDLLAEPPSSGALPFQVRSRTRDGGLLIDGGPDGFKSRTVSTTDIAWALEAKAYAEAHGDLLDEVLVNKLRYLEGTPKGSTRWIDSKHALAIVKAAW